MTILPLSNRILKVAILATAVLAFANTALADNITISRVGGYYTGNGGEFTLKGNDLSANLGILNNLYPNYAASTKAVGGDYSFQSFCLETNEYVDAPNYDYALNQSAVNGGAGGGSPDPVSQGTAYLYGLFATGGLGGYNYTPGAGRSASAGLLQEAIWFLEDELAYDASANTFVQQAITQYVTLAAAKTNAGVGQGVFALNLTYQGAKKQDMLVYGDVTRTVPDGGLTLMMLGVGLSGLAVLRRKLI